MNTDANPHRADRIEALARDVVARLRDHGHQAWWVGGCVRDRLLGRTPYDYDVATDARPEQVRRVFRRTIAVGAEFGVVQVVRRGYGVEVATFRADRVYSDGRHPDSVEYGSAEDDVRRRDFTVNALLQDPESGEVIDHVGGLEDLQQRVIRAIGNPVERFTEDKLRLLRAVRFAANLDFRLDEATAAAIPPIAPQLTVVSMERIRDEVGKMLCGPQPHVAMRLAMDLGLLEPVLPELLTTCGVPQGKPVQPTGDLWEHILLVLELLEQPSFTLALAALLHDVGKPQTLAPRDDRYSFHGHEHVGELMADDICRRLKLSTRDRRRVTWLVGKHQYLAAAPRMKMSKLKPVFAHGGFDELLELHRVDALATAGTAPHVDYVNSLLKDLSADQIDPPPLLTGHDLSRHGLEPGPQFGPLLAKVREAQLDGTLRSKKRALAFIDDLLASDWKPEDDAEPPRP